MDAPVIVIAVLLDVSLLLLLAAWAVRGGTDRMVVGLVASLVFGAIVGVPVYAVAYLLLRGQQRGRSASQATQKGTMSGGRLLPTPENNGVTRSARLLAVLAALAVGALVVFRGFVLAWVPDFIAQVPNPCPDYDGSPTQAWRCWHDVVAPAHFALGRLDPSVFVLALVAAVVTFLAIAALRWAWRSYR